MRKNQTFNLGQGWTANTVDSEMEGHPVIWNDTPGGRVAIFLPAPWDAGDRWIRCSLIDDDGELEGRLPAPITVDRINLVNLWKGISRGIARMNSLVEDQYPMDEEETGIALHPYWEMPHVTSFAKFFRAVYSTPCEGCGCPLQGIDAFQDPHPYCVRCDGDHPVLEVR